MGTCVTCPTYRYRPADVAHAFATLAATSIAVASSWASGRANCSTRSRAEAAGGRCASERSAWPSRSSCHLQALGWRMGEPRGTQLPAPGRQAIRHTVDACPDLHRRKRAEERATGGADRGRLGNRGSRGRRPRDPGRIPRRGSRGRQRPRRDARDGRALPGGRRQGRSRGGGPPLAVHRDRVGSAQRTGSGRSSAAPKPRPHWRRSTASGPSAKTRRSTPRPSRRISRRA